MRFFVGALCAIASVCLGGQAAAQYAVAPVSVVLPANTMVIVSPVEEITSIDMHEGDTEAFLVASDVAQNGVVMIPRGAPVTATVTWRTGKGIVGKSAKFELTFSSVQAGGRSWPLRGKYRQEGRGNTAGALLGAAIITGRSAVMVPGQQANDLKTSQGGTSSQPRAPNPRFSRFCKWCGGRQI